MFGIYIYASVSYLQKNSMKYVAYYMINLLFVTGSFEANGHEKSVTHKLINGLERLNGLQSEGINVKNSLLILNEATPKYRRFRREASGANEKLNTCLKMFRVSANTIIRTQDSKNLGAKYLNETQVGDRESCIGLCCENKDCNAVVYEEKESKDCYMFDCGPQEEFKCKFTSHSDYTSATLMVNHQQLDLQLWGAEEKLGSRTLEDTSTTKYTLPDQKDNACRRFEFQCQTGGECIAIYNVCDGIPQCKDESDESPGLACPSVTSAVYVSTAPEIVAPSTQVPHRDFNHPSKEYSPDTLKTNIIYPNPKIYVGPYDNDYTGRQDIPSPEHFNRHNGGLDPNWREMSHEYPYSMSDPYNDHLVRDDLYRYRPNNHFPQYPHRDGYGRDNAYLPNNPMYEWNTEAEQFAEPSPHVFRGKDGNHNVKAPVKIFHKPNVTSPTHKPSSTIVIDSTVNIIPPTTTQRVTTTTTQPKHVKPLKSPNFDVDGPTQHFPGAIFVLTIGLAMTTILVCILLWRYRLVRHKLKLGGKTFAYDADYLVNGMYL